MMLAATTSTGSSATSSRRDTLLIGLGVLVLCVVVTSGAWHGLDAYDFMNRLDRGSLTNPRHPLYLPLVALVAYPLQVLGVSLYSAAAAASSVGTAVGCAFLHRTCLSLGLARRDALVTTLAVAGSHGVLYYGSMIEIHGVFLGAAGLAWWVLVRYCRRPTAAAAAVTGIVGGFATAVHATGYLLPLPLCAAALALGARRAGRAVWWHFALLAALHVGVAVALRWAALPASALESTNPERSAGSYLQHLHGLGTEWRRAPIIAWNEWLRPFLPISALSVVAIAVPRCREWRGLAAGLLLSLVVYLGFTTVLLAPGKILEQHRYLPPHALVENGAYLLPLLLPAALLSVQALPQRARMLVPVLGLLWSVPQLLWPDRAPGDLDYGRSVIELVEREEARLLCGGYDEIDGVIELRPELVGNLLDPEPRTIVPVYALYIWLASNNDVPFEQVTLWFDYQYARTTAAGGHLIVTEQCAELMRATGDGLLDRLVDEHLPAHYRTTPVQQGRCRGWRLQRIE